MIIDDGWSSFLDFSEQESGFAQGFETGRLWLALGTTPYPFKEYVHDVSPEILNRLCEAYSCEATWEHLGDGWLEVTFRKAV